MVLRLRQHNIGYTADGFYRSDDPTNPIFRGGGWYSSKEQYLPACQVLSKSSGKFLRYPGHRQLQMHKQTKQAHVLCPL